MTSSPSTSSVTVEKTPTSSVVRASDGSSSPPETDGAVLPTTTAADVTGVPESEPSKGVSTQATLSPLSNSRPPMASSVVTSMSLTSQAVW